MALNYDETNLSDEPGQKKCVFRRGINYPERVINFSKGKHLSHVFWNSLWRAAAPLCH